MAYNARESGIVQCISMKTPNDFSHGFVLLWITPLNKAGFKITIKKKICHLNTLLLL